MIARAVGAGSEDSKFFPFLDATFPSGSNPQEPSSFWMRTNRASSSEITFLTSAINCATAMAFKGFLSSSVALRSSCSYLPIGKIR